jgi:hypothetical protein
VLVATCTVVEEGSDDGSEATVKEEDEAVDTPREVLLNTVVWLVGAPVPVNTPRLDAEVETEVIDDT